MTVQQFTINDNSNEKSSFAINTVNLTAANFDAQATIAANFAAAVGNLTIGELVKQTQNNVPLDSPATPTSVYAQREMKWLVSYRGNSSGKLFQVEIACPDLTDNVVPNTDVADITSTDWAAFKTLWDANVKSPDDLAETTVLVGAKLVGRNI